MHQELYLAFIFATVILMLIPGPNVALITANSVAHGTRYGLLTVAGTSSAMVIQLALTSLGMSSALSNAAAVFECIRWAGVAYLLYLGIRQWFATPADLTRIGPQARSVRVIYLRGFLVSLANPKTLLFLGAFLPQFVAPGREVGRQLLFLSVTFLFIALTLDGCWAVLAGRLRILLARHGRLRNRVSGGMLATAALGLAAVRRR